MARPRVPQADDEIGSIAKASDVTEPADRRGLKRGLKRDRLDSPAVSGASPDS